MCSSDLKLAAELNEHVFLADALAFEARYWRWRDCFNELGRWYDPVSQDVYLEQAGMVWGGLAAMSLLAGIGLVASLRRKQS